MLVEEYSNTREMFFEFVSRNVLTADLKASCSTFRRSSLVSEIGVFNQMGRNATNQIVVILDL